MLYPEGLLISACVCAPSRVPCFFCPQLREALNKREADSQVSAQMEGCAWMPEYGSWMIEGTPRTPYAGYSVALDSPPSPLNFGLHRTPLPACSLLFHLCAIAFRLSLFVGRSLVCVGGWGVE